MEYVPKLLPFPFQYNIIDLAYLSPDNAVLFKY